MDERERPPYLGDLPRDRRGNWPMYLLAAGLLAALIGGWKIYTGTVAAWHERFQAPRAAQTRPEPAGPRMTPEERALRLREDEELIRRWREKQDRERASWKCIDGTPFRPLPGGGWENVRGEHC